MPAPLGPMIARTSCSRTSKLMSVSAFTPPKASEMLSSLRMTSPMRPSSGARVMANPARSPRPARPCMRRPPRACTGANVLASSIRRSAATMLVRPSSKRTSVSMCCTALPPYSASISTAYFSATKPRRTLRVRVSSSSSGSSSLCRIRKRWICDSASPASRRQFRVHLLDAFADQVVDLRLLREVGVAGVGEAAPLGPVADRADVDVDERARHRAAVAEDHRLLDVREELELVLEVVRREHRAIRRACPRPWRGR